MMQNWFRHNILVVVAAVILLGVGMSLGFRVTGESMAEEQAGAPAKTGTPSELASPDEVVVGVSPGPGEDAIWLKHFPPAKPALHLTDTIESFSATDDCVPNILRTLANNFGLRYGIEVIPWKTPAQPGKSGSLDVENMSVRETLDEILTIDSRYTWNRDREYVNFVLGDAYKMPDYPLNIVIPKFEVTEEPYARAIQRIMVIVQEETGFGSGMGLRHPPDFGPQVTTFLEDATPRQILNEIARQSSMSWEIHSFERDKGVVIMGRKVGVPEKGCGCGQDSTAPQPAIATD